PPYGGGTPDKVGATLWDDANHVSTNYYYSASHPSCLKLTATKEDNYYCECSANCNSSNSCFTQPFHYKTGLIESIQHDFTYPLKIEIYCKLPHDKGFNPAFWIWGEDANGMCCSEIDVFELFIKEPSTTVDRVKELDFNFHHYQNPKLSSGTKYYSDIDLSDNFHTYAVEWSYDNIKWLVDGDVRRIVSRTAGTLALWPDAYPGNPQPNPTQLRMVVNLGVNPDCGDCSDDCNGVACDGWTPCEDSNEPDCNAQFPQSFYVDWVKIYSQTQCKSFAICNDDDESSQHTTNVEGYNIDLAVSKDVDYDQHNEDDWCCAGQDFPVTGGPNYQNDLTCALNVISNYDVKAENIITMHEGFLADDNSFANSTDLFVARIDPCNAHRLTANGNSNNNNLNTTHANASVFQEK